MKEKTEDQFNENEKERFQKQPSRLTIFLQIIKTMRIEPFLFLFMFGESARRASLQNLLEDKACHLYFQFPTEICSNLSNYTTKEDDVTRVANNYSMIITLISMIPGIFLSVIVGPWSDKHGRKIPMLFATFGVILELIGYLLTAIFFDLPLYYNVLSAIPAGLTAGMIIILGSVFSMISETSSKKYRTVKFFLLEMSIILGSPLGTEVGGQLYRFYGYVCVFAVSLGVVTISFLWVLFFVQDSKKYEHHMKIKDLIKDLFSIENIKNSFHTCIKKRENHVRAQIWLLMITMCCLMMGFMGTSSIGYFYAQKMYNWEVTQYSDVSAIFSIAKAVLMLPLVIILTKIYNVKEPVIGILGAISIMTENIIKGLSTYQWLYYLSNVVSIPAILAAVAVRSRMSKLVPQEELGE
ncbi:proton-coupled folate transporter-like [Limulus polyphemus]|uniref:Proton-coupled folate transporter-like n=1 Tax=Limulus polyphemus TaxID=6850 RepID=A0ABM1BW78_LIMPO|nr:proton-coupled folate transporter-like [Limulus polyphemus]